MLIKISMNKKKVIFVYSGGRREKLHNNIEAKEFFYCFFNFKEEGYEVNFIEFTDRKVLKLNFLHLIDRFFNRILSLPFYTHKIMNKKNFRILRDAADIYFVNESTFFSSIPFLIYFRIFGYKKNVYLFSMGMFSKNLYFKKLRILHNYFLKTSIRLIHNIFFLGEGEFSFAKSKFPLSSDKFKFVPFSIDTNFWQSSSVDLSNNNEILFIGNDGNRDYEMLQNIIEQNTHLNFTVITDHPSFKITKTSNFNHINGSWRESLISDSELKKIYENSRLVILPLKNSLQPSGQSVCLQAMSLGIPVIISNTVGFWDKKTFINEKHLIFNFNDTIASWNHLINYYFNNLKVLNNLSKNSTKLVQKEFNLDEMYRKIIN